MKAGPLADVERFVEELAASDRFSGAVLVAGRADQLLAVAHGYASKGLGVPNRLDTKFNLASMNKMFTGVAVAQLVERGELGLEDRVAERLPWYCGDGSERITVEHLLTHTSGLGTYWNERFEASKATRRTVRDFVPLFEDEPLAFEPGHGWQYSNAGYILLGAIVEAVTARSYFDVVRERIYAPAGMANTDAYEVDCDVPNLALGYTRAGEEGGCGPGTWRTNVFMHVAKGGPAGGGYSTVADLVRFARALLEHRLLGADWTARALTGKVDAAALGPGVRYGFGFAEGRVAGTRVVGHGGEFPGISGQLDIYPERELTVAVLSNYDPPAALEVAEHARGLVAAGLL